MRAALLGAHGVAPLHRHRRRAVDAISDRELRRATQLTVSYRIDGTPAMAVQGRYTVSADQGRSQKGMLDTVDYLVDMLRKKK